MGFWNKVGKAVGTAIEKAPEAAYKLQQESAKREVAMKKEVVRRLNENEAKVEAAEKSGRMKDPEFARKVHEGREKIEKVKSNINKPSSSYGNLKTNSNGEVTYGGYTIRQWNGKWIQLGRLSSLTIDDLSQYNKQIGLYKAEKNGKTVYVGKAVEHSNGGFRKRLRDYVRGSDSGRTHGSGRKMFENREQISISILIVGDSANDVETVIALEQAMIGYNGPGWNVQHNR
ncbi:hypothetical protein [Guptibacillus spartinae]|uniref:hypothetical protein n=1 Tax=Guptibacillus spartinae TaxID=3025679 RepID=UPI00235DC751|nr:hypothetical protein [Pseudalkalibacillus spartinae]